MRLKYDAGYYHWRWDVDAPVWASSQGVEHGLGESDRPTISKRERSSGKVLYTFFFTMEGILLQLPTPQGRMVTGSYYAESVLPLVLKAFQKNDHIVNFVFTMTMHLRIVLLLWVTV
jgi:hypothetical protein